MATQDPNAADPNGGAPAPGAAPDNGQGGGQPANQPPAPAVPADPNAAPQPGNLDDINQGWQKRVDALVAKQKALEDQLAKLQTPAPAAPTANGGDDGFRFEAYDGFKKQFLGNDPQATAFFDAFKDAITSDMDRAIVAYVENKLRPFGDRFQNQEKEQFFGGNAEAKAKEAEIEAVRQKYPGMTYEDAWKLVNYGNAAPAARPPRLPPPSTPPRSGGAPSNLNAIPRGKGISAIVEAVAAQKGL